MLKKFMGIFNYKYIFDIKIQNRFKEHPPKYTKLMEKELYYIQNNKFKDDIILNRKDVLIDGYTAYILSHRYNKKWVKVKYV